MNKKFITLGIETSCDDTGVAVLQGQREVLADLLSSQIKDHAPFGGVVPEFASRKHLEAILPLVKAALKQAGVNNPARELDLIAVTAGPGLMGSLLVGVMAAKALAQAWELPVIGVNHLEGHIFANLIRSPQLEPPFLCLIVSGGHTEINMVRSYGDYILLGETRDDAAGEAYDKVAKLLGLGYPGGPVIDRMSKDGDPDSFSFPVPMKNHKEIIFSYSGLKTAVIWQVKDMVERGMEVPLYDICASFQKAAVDALISKLEIAVDLTGINKVALSGGVAANSELRQNLRNRKGWDVFIPPMSYCTDNGVMIAAAGYNAYHRGVVSDLYLSPDPSWRLTSR